MIRGTPTGYSADVPDLPGGGAAAKTVPATRRVIAEAITFHLERMEQSGEPIPAPRQRLEVAVDASDEEFCTSVEVEVPESVYP
jgi:predicted RNase H-like HicB family nuclease